MVTEVKRESSGKHPPISPSSNVRRLLRRGYEGREGYDRQAGPTHWLFQGPPVESKLLAALVTWADFATIGAASDIPSGYTVAENGAAADTIVVTSPKSAATKKFARVSAA